MLRFHIRARGDVTTGNGDHYAVVKIPFAVTTAEYTEAVREELRGAFARIFDDKKVVVETSMEVARREAADRSNDPYDVEYDVNYAEDDDDDDQDLSDDLKVITVEDLGLIPRKS